VSTSVAKPVLIVAMGGHAFMQKGEVGTIEDHERSAARIAEILMTLVNSGYEMVITHGNGPQVGSLLIQNECCKNDVAPMPLDVLVSMTEGSLGYILQQSLLNELRRQDTRRFVVTVVTQVLVDEADPAFEAPSKPIGPFFSKDEAQDRAKRLGWKVQEETGRGWRRLVASPRPIKVIQRDMIRDAARSGHVVVACGGGGIPIVEKPDGRYTGIEAVIDKDLTSSVLGVDIGAELLIILTAVPNVYVDFGKPEQRALGAVTIEEIERLQAEGHFAPGSMGPKIEAVIQFLRRGGRRALITNPESLPEAIEGRGGTHLIGAL
jgi:carbamate kinase